MAPHLLNLTGHLSKFEFELLNRGGSQIHYCLKAAAHRAAAVGACSHDSVPNRDLTKLVIFAKVPVVGAEGSVLLLPELEGRRGLAV